MTTPLLFDIPSSRMFGAQAVRAKRRAEVAALKLKHGIQTHNAPGAGGWVALSMTQCVKVLEGYGLTDDEKTNLFDMISGYCRLLDDAHLIEDGHATEWAAVTACAKRLEP